MDAMRAAMSKRELPNTSNLGSTAPETTPLALEPIRCLRATANLLSGFSLSWRTDDISDFPSTEEPTGQRRQDR